MTETFVRCFLPLIVVTTGIAWAGDLNNWKHVAVDGPSNFYVDETSIEVVGDHVEAFELADYADDGSKWRSIKSRVRYKCADGSAGVVRDELFSGAMGSGTIVESRPGNLSYKISQPGTTGFWLTAFVCSRANGMGPNNSFKPNPLRGSA